AIEKLLEGCDSKFATGDEVQLADVFLAPQIHAGVTRFDIDMVRNLSSVVSVFHM
uniref:GST C-terminal domain-containing protein n=1 Tax=Aegilops tauschii subsp. strangulata TaxID=200361 RepID=A0A453SYG4_AEGTS